MPPVVKPVAQVVQFADFQADLRAGDMRLSLTPILLKNVVLGLPIFDSYTVTNGLG